MKENTLPYKSENEANGKFKGRGSKTPQSQPFSPKHFRLILENLMKNTVQSCFFRVGVLADCAIPGTFGCYGRKGG